MSFKKIYSVHFFSSSVCVGVITTKSLYQVGDPIVLDGISYTIRRVKVYPTLNLFPEKDTVVNVNVHCDVEVSL